MARIEGGCQALGCRGWVAQVLWTWGTGGPGPLDGTCLAWVPCPPPPQAGVGMCCDMQRHAYPRLRLRESMAPGRRIEGP